MSSLVGEWCDIDDRERAVGVRDGTPILIDPMMRVDPHLARFLGRSRFSFLALGTRESYVKDYRLFFTFLWRRGRYWNEATPDDIDDYEAWRRRAPENPRRIGGAKWARELAAFTLLYGWAVDRGHMTRNPVVYQAIRRPGRPDVDRPVNQPKDVRCSNVKWVTPRTFRLWRDIGLRGYAASGLPQPGWRGRNDGRNAAFADLLFETGLRLREGGCLLTIDIPAAVAGRGYYEAPVAAAIAKHRERMCYIPAAVVEQITAYVVTTRAAAIRRAQREHRYDALTTKRIVSTITDGRRRSIEWTDERARAGRAPVDALGADERRRLFTAGPNGLEPLQLWLTEGGMPMDYRSWEAVFVAANRRCDQLSTSVHLSPHMCRHSFALKMLVTLQRALDVRFGIDGDEREHLKQIYGNVFHLVKDLLGHRSEQTTRNIYLEPVNGIRLAMLLDNNNQDDLDQLLGRLASSSSLVLDVAPGERAQP